jgi:heat shock protein HtpX
MASFFDEIAGNQLRSSIIIVIFLALVVLVGSAIGYFWVESSWFGAIMALVIGGIYFMIAWFSGSDMILSITGAKPVTKREYPHLYHAVEGLAIAAGVPTPQCFVIEDTALNAFATGRDPEHSAICVTTGLLKALSRQELEGVIAHEMSHIKNYDIRVMMLSSVLVGVLVLLSDIFLRSFLWGGSDDREWNSATVIFLVIGIALIVLSPIIGMLMQLALSRKREYLADATGAMLTRYPQGLANALKKISKDPDPLVDNANRATAHLFISTPFRGEAFTNLFATHPPIKERIKRLEAM